MKRTLWLALFAVTTVGGVWAQNIEQGNIILGGYSNAWLTGGRFRLDYDDPRIIDPDEIDTFLVGLGFWAGYFVRDGLQLGIEAYLRYYRADYPNDYSFSEVKEFGGRIGPQVGYFFDVGTQFVPYVQLTAYYTYSRDETDGQIDDEDRGFGVRPRGGVNVFVTDSVGLALSAYLSVRRWTDLDSDPRFDFHDTDYGLEFNIVVALDPSGGQAAAAGSAEE